MDSEQTRYSSRPAHLGEILAGLSEAGPAGIDRRYETGDKLRGLWQHLLPPAMAQHCRMVDFSHGIVTVEADSPAFLYELRLSSSELVSHLRMGCPSAKVRAIKVTLGH